ncbi:hypothetical protein BZJ17_12900 [Salinivibrio sp. IB574]|uniref:hypothetical protein n=1 Tax=Salinivibrio sp. IB574 TaxID=1909444 RepID=UPI0009894C9E|nr:hypothetical protein [Salinivibrio sp. IB574]OOF20431.1 hypothetical protein BZJ17_12900 [Salinivibrio sp. IB574]
MAAEKLTKGRLTQILVMLTLLISAFIWRTLIYTPGLSSIDCDGRQGVCGTSHSPKLLSYQWQEEGGNLKFSLISKTNPHAAYWLEDGAQAPKVAASSEETPEGVQRVWQWTSETRPEGQDTFVVVIDQYQFNFNYLKKPN